MNVCGIYKATNMITGDAYVGQTKNFKRRIWEHKSSAKRNAKMKISQAIAEYGFEKFSFEMLEECATEKLDEREQFYIAKLKPAYNVCVGGKGSRGRKLSDEEKERSRRAGKMQWASMTEEQKQNVIKNNLKGPRKGHTVSEETREKLRQHNLGKKASPETIEKRRAALKGKKRENKHRWKAVRCVETGEVFPQMKLAAQKYGLTPSGITAVLSGRQKTCGRFHWIYES